MDEAFKEITNMMQSGAWLIAKILFIYILLPEILALIVIGGVLRIRGELFKILMMAVTLLCGYLFYRFGLHQLVNEVDNITQ
ncbi:hypothetical protein [Cohnella abietis]|uniref:Uncharacterized protein n=1 Tax=Cohnella abietis TaxID=2507935 RepID=A0A3T1D7L9_9BACL|nr:hypothetical protein [Cohnella abietis]BBI34080.1 hypothetical protein KCTCHS21_34790 [Cohnella abietis]